MADRNAKGRQARVKGEASGMAKLTESSVRTIRSRLSERHPQKALAVEFGVSVSTIKGIANGTSWRHIE